MTLWHGQLQVSVNAGYTFSMLLIVIKLNTQSILAGHLLHVCL